MACCLFPKDGLPSFVHLHPCCGPLVVCWFAGIGPADGGVEGVKERCSYCSSLNLVTTKYRSCDLLRVGSNDFEQKIEILYCQHDGYPRNDAETTDSDCHFTRSVRGLKSKYFFFLRLMNFFDFDLG